MRVRRALLLVGLTCLCSGCWFFLEGGRCVFDDQTYPVGSQATPATGILFLARGDDGLRDAGLRHQKSCYSFRDSTGKETAVTMQSLPFRSDYMGAQFFSTADLASGETYTLHSCGGPDWHTFQVAAPSARDSQAGLASDLHAHVGWAFDMGGCGHCRDRTGACRTLTLDNIRFTAPSAEGDLVGVWVGHDRVDYSAPPTILWPPTNGRLIVHEYELQIPWYGGRYRIGLRPRARDGTYGDPVEVRVWFPPMPWPSLLAGAMALTVGLVLRAIRRRRATRRT